MTALMFLSTDEQKGFCLNFVVKICYKSRGSLAFGSASPVKLVIVLRTLKTPLQLDYYVCGMFT